MRSYYKQSCLDRAKQLLEKNDDDSIIYAALELRQSIEAVLYEKIKGYTKIVPGIVFEKWQPPHILKTLLQFEPGAEEDFRLAIAPESEPGVRKGPFELLGEHKAIKLKWLNKNYNKLGSYLHVAQKSNKTWDYKIIRQELLEISSELDELVKNTVTFAALAKRIQFKCQVCNSNSLVNTESLKNTNQAICIDPNCGAIHHFDEVDSGWNIHLEASMFKCLKCEKETRVENRYIDVGSKFDCASCGIEHVFVQRHWSYGVPNENE